MYSNLHIENENRFRAHLSGDLTCYCITETVLHRAHWNFANLQGTCGLNFSTIGGQQFYFEKEKSSTAGKCNVQSASMAIKMYSLPDTPWSLVIDSENLQKFVSTGEHQSICFVWRETELCHLRLHLLDSILTLLTNHCERLVRMQWFFKSSRSIFSEPHSRSWSDKRMQKRDRKARRRLNKKEQGEK